MISLKGRNELFPDLRAGKGRDMRQNIGMAAWASDAALGLRTSKEYVVAWWCDEGRRRKV